MAAKKGNKYAQGCKTSGAPRTVTPPEPDMIALGKEMIEWVEKHPEILHLSEWYTIEKMITYNTWKTYIVKNEFFPYYEKALKIVGRKYLDKSSNVRDGISQRWQRIYFSDLKEQEDADKEFEANLKPKEDNADEEYKKVLDKTLSAIDQMQAHSLALKTEAIKTSAAHKSDCVHEEN